MSTIVDYCDCYSVLDYTTACRNQTLADRFFIMRHDVDGNVGNAIEMAKIDARYGIRATYYFRMKPRLFQPHVVRAVAELGHEIGYHYEVLSDTRGDFSAARELFETNLSTLSDIAPVKTVCMHGASLSKHHNLDFWKKNTLEDFGLVAEPYLTIDYSDMYYFSDTGLCWDNRQFNLRDLVSSREHVPMKNTPALIQFIHSIENLKGAMLTHTNIWTDRIPVLMFYKMAFWGINRVKYIKKKMSAP
jgi:hypothetical protein